ncbi:hypothetical protein QTI85_13810 [Clostridium perfringens]|nr:hypothetical protein [Clostridium perfringens]
MKDRIKNLSPYVLLVVLTIIVTKFVFVGAGDIDFVNTFSFGSTISSILLSLIAIFYTFLDSRDSNKILGEINSSTNEMKKSIKEFNKLNDILKSQTDKFDNLNNIMKENADKLKKLDDLESILDKFSEKIMKSNEEMARAMMNQHYFNNEYKDEMRRNEVNLDNKTKDEIIRNFSHEIRRNCLFICKSYEYDKEIKILSFNRFFNQILIEEDFGEINIIDNFLATLQMLDALNFIKYKFNEIDNILIESLDNEFIRVIREVVPSEEFIGDAWQSRLYGTVYRYFENLDK